MAEHPIQGLMTTAMESIKDMVDVNTIVGDAVQAPDGTVIIPISRVAFGFAAGGGEYNSCCEVDAESGQKGTNSSEDEESKGYSGKFPFAGGSGAGVSINPVAFVVVNKDNIKLMPVNTNSSVDKMLDLVPDIIDKANEVLGKKMHVKKEIKADDFPKGRKQNDKSEE